MSNSGAVPKALYAITIFLSAFLLFEVQPMIAKIILPWFGGAAAVWTVCLLFFQTALLLGYLYAHVVTKRLAARAQAWTHVALLALSVATLRILPSDSWKPTGPQEPALHILLLLAVTIGLPYFLLSATSPLLQFWYARSGDGATPYRLYALSNIGSMLALIAYPALVEPRLATSHQTFGWSALYAAFALLCGFVAWSQSRQRQGTVQDVPDLEAEQSVPGLGAKALWVALPACGSLLLLSITTHLTHNIASAPLLWVLPLALYLLSFVLCFDGRGWYRRGFFLRLLGLGLACIAYSLSPSFENLPLAITASVYCGGLFICCMFCHGELTILKPPPKYLTSFYLSIAAGSALGALFVALIAPSIFSEYWELPVALSMCALLVPVVHGADPLSRFYRPAWKAQIRQPGWLMLAVVACAITAGLISDSIDTASRVRIMRRNFYGVLSVVEELGPSILPVQGRNSSLILNDLLARKLVNGTIDHGLQWLAPSRRREPTAYYSTVSGVGIALRAAQREQPAMRVGVIGLGTGTLAAYGRTGDLYTFYEINPLVEQLARRQFTFLSDSQARTEVVLGDARLMLERESPRNYDLLAVDAFSGDSIPIHLLTIQAFELYFHHLNKDGVLAVHISNRYLDLRPVVSAAAARLNKEAVLIENLADRRTGVFRSSWVLVGDLRGFLGRAAIEKAGAALRDQKEVRLWTDDYSSLFPLLQ